MAKITTVEQALGAVKQDGFALENGLSVLKLRAFALQH